MKTLIIKKEDLRHNIKQIKELAYQRGKDDKGNLVQIIARIKEDAYGLGLIEYTKFLIQNGISFFAVETIEEGISLRKAEIKEEILMISPTAIKEDIKILAENNIILSIGSKEDVQIVDQIGKEQKKKIRVHLNIDTGIGIRGWNGQSREEMIIALKESQNIKIEGTYSEFVNSKKDDKYTKLQFQRFLEVIEILQMNQIPTGMLHICDDSAFFKYTNMHLNAIRIGKAFLGEVEKKTSLSLKTVKYLETQVVEKKQVSKGFYLGKDKIKKDLRIAVIPYISPEKIQTDQIIIQNHKYKILGNIENNILCDMGTKEVKIGEKIIFPIKSNSRINLPIRREYR